MLIFASLSLEMKILPVNGHLTVDILLLGHLTEFIFCFFEERLILVVKVFL